MAGVDDEGNAGADFMAELDGQGVVAGLGVGQCRGGELAFGGVIVQVDVLAPEDVPVEPPILNLVLTEVEVLRLHRARARRQSGQHSDQGTKAGEPARSAASHADLPQRAAARTTAAAVSSCESTGSSRPG